MRALFGEGRHPDAARIEAMLRAAGRSERRLRRPRGWGSPSMCTRRGTDSVTGAPSSSPSTTPASGCHGTGLCLRTLGPGSAPRSQIRCFASSTGALHPILGNGRGSWPGSPDRPLLLSPAMTSRSARSRACRRCGRSPPDRWQSRSRLPTALLSRTHWPGRRRPPLTPAPAREGVAQVDVTGLLAAAFMHRDSRAGDPDLHTHVAISNKVQTATDGRWLALDGRPIHKLTVAASERYNTRLEAELARPARGRVRATTGHRTGQATGAGTGRDGCPAAGRLVQTPGPDRGPPRRARRRIPGRAPPAPQPDRSDRTGAAGHPGNPAGQAPAAVAGRAARRHGRTRRARCSAARRRCRPCSPRCCPRRAAGGAG